MSSTPSTSTTASSTPVIPTTAAPSASSRVSSSSPLQQFSAEVWAALSSDERAKWKKRFGRSKKRHNRKQREKLTDKSKSSKENDKDAPISFSESSNADNECWLCGESGHSKKACPHPLAAAGKKIQCLYCRKKGHTLEQCSDYATAQTRHGTSTSPSSSTSSATKKFCYNCGSDSHTHKTCEQPLPIDGKFPFVPCFHCKKTGHVASTCPAKQMSPQEELNDANSDKQQQQQGIYPRGGSCHSCGSVWHLSRDCKDKNKTENKRKRIEENESEQKLKQSSEATKVNEPHQPIFKKAKVTEKKDLTPIVAEKANESPSMEVEQTHSTAPQTLIAPASASAASKAGESHSKRVKVASGDDLADDFISEDAIQFNDSDDETAADTQIKRDGEEEKVLPLGRRERAAAAKERQNSRGGFRGRGRDRGRGGGRGRGGRGRGRGRGVGRGNGRSFARH